MMIIIIFLLAFIGGFLLGCSANSISADKALLQVQNLELINRIAELEAQLAQMTAERDSESRWAKEYFNRFNVLEERYSIFEEMAPPDISRKEFAEMCFKAWKEKQASNA